MNQVIYDEIPFKNRGDYFEQSSRGYISIDDIVRHKNKFYIKRKAKVRYNPFKGDIEFKQVPNGTLMADYAVLYLPTNLQHKWYEENINLNEYHEARYVDVPSKKLTFWERLDAFLFPH